MKAILLLFICLTISVVSFAQDKAASKDAAPEISPGPSMKETEAWIKRELPPLGSFSVVEVKNDDRSNPLTKKYGIESAVLSDCRLLLRRTEAISSEGLGAFVRLTYTETATLKDVAISQLGVVEEIVVTEYTHSRPSYAVTLFAVADRGEPFTSQRKQEGFPASDRKPTRWVSLDR